MSCKSCNNFGSNCHTKMKFGVTCPRQTPNMGSKYNSFGSNCHQEHRMKFGVKAGSIKGYSSLTKDQIKSFYVINGIDIPMDAPKDKLYNNLKKTYSNITPADIKLSVSQGTTLANIRVTKQSQNEAEERARKEALEEKERQQRAKIKKITYAPRDVPKNFEPVLRRLPAGSKVKRLTRPSVSEEEMDDLSDMFSATRASPDEMLDLLTKLNVKFGKNKFGKNKFGA